MAQTDLIKDEIHLNELDGYILRKIHLNSILLFKSNWQTVLTLKRRIHFLYHYNNIFAPTFSTIQTFKLFNIFSYFFCKNNV